MSKLLSATSSIRKPLYEIPNPAFKKKKRGAKMIKKSEKLKAIKHLQTLRNIGPKMAEKLYALGIKTAEQMRKSNPEELFERLKQ